MGGTTGSDAASDSAAATAAALRGASLAFGRQKKAEAEANSRQLQQQQHLPPPKQRQGRLPSVSPSRESTISNTQATNALLAATSAAASSRDASVSSAGTRSGGRAGSSLLRPVSPGQQSTAARSSSSSRSRSRGRNAPAAVAALTSAGDFGSSPSSGIVSSSLPAINRTRMGGGSNNAGGSLTVPISSPTPLRHPRSTSFLAATLAASQAASPGITPSHTGQQGGQGNGGGAISATSTGGRGPVPAHISAALLASAASDEKRRAAAAAAAANYAATASRVNDDMARYGIRIGQQTDEDDEPDTSAIPATSSLVSMFEKGKNGGPRGKTGTRRGQADDRSSSSSSSPVRPPKPKAFTPPRSLSPAPREEALLAKTPARTPMKAPAKTPTRPVTKESTKPSPKPPTKPPARAASANIPAKEETAQQMEQSKPQPQPQPKPKATADPKPESQQAKPIPIPKPKPQPAATQEKSSPLEKLERLERASTGTSPLRQHRLSLRELNDDDGGMGRPSPPKPRMRDSSSASSRSATKDRGPPVRAASFASRGPPPLAPPRRAANALVAHHTAGSASPLRKPVATASSVDGLASAIMAGSLAAALHPPSSQSASSSVPGSRSRTPPVPPATRSTSPTKRTGMLQTLRRDRAHSDDDDYDRDGTSSGNTHYRRSHYHRDGRLRQGKLHLSHATPTVLGGGRHKHKHHEGSRRRWREAVTERQRRRYEAVWASNRGQRGLVVMDNNDDGTVDEADDDDTVPNVVVRDLWRRSRLPVDELAEVWDLVDETGTGRLGKAGFVVGLWLIDQRLRGRKIPARVSESVWSSARGMPGMQATSKQRMR